MMTPDDPRHGTNAGYYAGCTDTCCKDAAARYQRGLEWDHLQGRPRTVPIVGARRRIEALMALGWSMETLSVHAGYSRAWLHVTINRNHSGRIYRRNHDTIVRLYDELSMTLPPQTNATGRQRRQAARRGYAPPLAWDDDTIDDPVARPRRGDARPVRLDADEVAVLRRLNGDRVDVTVAERRAAVAQLWHQGLPASAIARRCGFVEDTVEKDIERLGLRRNARAS